MTHFRLISYLQYREQWTSFAAPLSRPVFDHRPPSPYCHLHSTSHSNTKYILLHVSTCPLSITFFRRATWVCDAVDLRKRRWWTASDDVLVNLLPVVVLDVFAVLSVSLIDGNIRHRYSRAYFWPTAIPNNHCKRRSHFRRYFGNNSFDLDYTQESQKNPYLLSKRWSLRANVKPPYNRIYGRLHIKVPSSGYKNGKSAKNPEKHIKLSY